MITATALAVSVIALIDADWAIPINTLLLLILAIYQHRNSQNIKATKRIAKESHNELADVMNGEIESDQRMRKFRRRDM